MKRIVIIGNSGAGKSFLARELSSTTGIPIIHLDELFWAPGGFNLKRPPEVVSAEIDARSLDESWIVEGVFGDLAGSFLERTEHLIWLDLPWPVCKDGLLTRGSESSKQLEPAAAEATFTKLLDWAAGYWKRTGPCSHAGHQEIFDNFQGSKQRVSNRNIIPQLPGADGQTCGGDGGCAGSDS